MKTKAASSRPVFDPTNIAGTPYASLMIAVLAIAVPAKRSDSRGRELPLNNDRSSNQQSEKDRQHHRGYEPFTKIEFMGIGHMTACLVEAGAQHSQSPITAGGGR